MPQNDNAIMLKLCILFQVGLSSRGLNTLLLKALESCAYLTCTNWRVLMELLHHSHSFFFFNQQCYKNCTVHFVKVTIRLLCMFLTCICSILKYQNHSFEKCNTLEHTNLGNKLIVQIILNSYICSQLYCSLKISSWEGFSQTSCKFKLNFCNFKALLVTYWSFDRSKIGFLLYKTKTTVPFRNVSIVELITLMWFKHFYFVCTA